MTEVIPNTNDPKFMKSFIFSHNEDKPSDIKIVIFDVDNFNDLNNLEKHELIGEVNIDL